MSFKAREKISSLYIVCVLLSQSPEFKRGEIVLKAEKKNKADMIPGSPVNLDM